MEYKSGDQVCGCTLRQKCGIGAYGEVWLAEDSIGARVAVKIISNQGRYSERELAGLKNYKDCNHPNLLKIRYVEITDERICCIMDAADNLNHGKGEYQPDTLANRLNKFGRMDGKEITAMLDGLLAGLEELHKNGLVHRDIKPDNILWVNGRPTLADAGLIAPEGKGSLVGTLEKVAAHFAAHPETELLHGDLQVNGRRVKPPSGLASFGGFRVFHPTVFMRREVFEKYGPFDLSFPICADLAFFLKAGRAGVRFTHLDETLTDFAIGGVSTKRRKATAKEVRRILLDNGYGPLFANGWYCAMRLRALAAAIVKRS